MNNNTQSTSLSPTYMLMNLTRRTCKEIKYLNFLHNQAENLSRIFLFCMFARICALTLERLRNGWFHENEVCIKPNQPLKNTPAVKLLKCDYIYIHRSLILPSIHHYENHELKKNYGMSIRATKLTTKCSTSNSFLVCMYTSGIKRKFSHQTPHHLLFIEDIHKQLFFYVLVIHFDVLCLPKSFDGFLKCKIKGINGYKI